MYSFATASNARLLALPTNNAAAACATSRSSFVCGRVVGKAAAPPRMGRARVSTAPVPQMALGKAVVAGGTGFVGSRVVCALVERGADVTVLTRRKASAGSLPEGVIARPWAPDPLTAVGGEGQGWEESLKGADVVINVCGERVVSRWTPETKANILSSRAGTNKALADAILGMDEADRPKCVIGTSAVGYYGKSLDGEFHESASPARGDFLADVCVALEEAAQPIADAGVRLALLRVGVVIGVGGGALARMLPYFKNFVGGPIGSGSQWMSWVHVDDLVGMYLKVAEDASMQGAYNATAPAPATMAEFSAELASAIGRPNLVPVPGVALKLTLGDASGIVLEGQKVVPARFTSERSYEFAHPTLASCMAAVAREV